MVVAELNQDYERLFRELLLRRCGLHIRSGTDTGLYQAIEERMRATGCETVEEYFLKLSDSSQVMEAGLLINGLTIGETFFLRNRPSFEALEHKVLPLCFDICKKEDRPLKVLSAGCSTGEEVYSIALTILESFPGRPFHVLGLDINLEALSFADKGIYGSYALRHIHPKTLNKFFVLHQANQFQVGKELRANVSFLHGNLADERDSIGADRYDVIFCRNVFIYFQRDLYKRSVERLAKNMFSHSVLFLGHAESLFGVSDRYRSSHFGEAVYYMLNDYKSSEKKPEKRHSLPPLPGGGSKTADIHSSIQTLKEAPPVESLARKNERARELYERALVEVLEEHRNEAVSMLNECIELDSYLVDACLLRARVLADLGKIEEAEKSLARALQLSPLRPEAHVISALICMSSEKDEGVESCCKKALFLEPKFLPALFYLGTHLASRQRDREAGKNLKELKRLLENGEGVFFDFFPELSKGYMLGYARDMLFSVSTRRGGEQK